MSAQGEQMGNSFTSFVLHFWRFIGFKGAVNADLSIFIIYEKVVD